MTTLPDGYSDSAESQRQVRGRTPRLRHHALSSKRHPGRVLLVDDDLKFQNILRTFLELKGFRVIVASSGQDALAEIARSTPRVVLLDVKMPGMDGILTLKQIRLAYPTLPVIFATQLDEDDMIGAAGLLGVNGYLTKPFSFEGLEAILRTTIFT